ncbi:AIR synthase-related protein [Halorientalis regularis]|uniref:Hydrogenase expression/formation protein HypE n=1 Tax=Halorientalis regularis TaxID=660518 RepID=A0A1G7PVC2_9EURY|nr:AIR synthase-related protein [Halorientalis regularis]SDF90198.1 hydrogenase expression/formation protein HypE [Halorientalis regularis]
MTSDTKPAIEATGPLSIQYEPLLAEAVDADTLQATQDRVYDMSPVRDALTAAAAGPVTAMHDATECGIYGGLFEMGRAADVRIEIERDAVPVQHGVVEACDFFGIDPWISISGGTRLATVGPSGVDDVLAALDDEGIPAADVGEVVARSGLAVDGQEQDHPG